MSESPTNPAKSNDPEVLRKYFIESLGYSSEEADPIIKNWLRSPQTPEEVESGVRWERECREEITNRRLEQEDKENPNKKAENK